MKPHCLNALVLSALFVLGCSETEEVVGKQHDAGIPAELLEPAQRLGTAWAGKEAACEKAELELTRAYWTAFFENRAAAVAPGGLLFDPAAVTPCVAAMESLACHEVGLSIPPVLPAACDEVFYGTAAIGEPCNPGCERGATCLLARQSDAWCSRCVKRLVEGEVCTDEPAEGRCASGLVCSGGKGARPRANRAIASMRRRSARRAATAPSRSCASRARPRAGASGAMSAPRATPASRVGASAGRVAAPPAARPTSASLTPRAAIRAAATPSRSSSSSRPGSASASRALRTPASPPSPAPSRARSASCCRAANSRHRAFRARPR